MAVNIPGPFVLKVFYGVTPTGFSLIEHVAQFNLALSAAPTPGDPFSSITAQCSAGTVALNTLADDLIGYLRPLFDSTEATFDYCELWKIDQVTLEPQFVSSYDVGLAATSATPSKVSTQTYFTFRTAEGGIMRPCLMEDIYSGSQKYGYSLLDTPSKAFVDFLLGSAAYGKPFLARDTSYPISFLRICPSQNEVLFRLRYR